MSCSSTGRIPASSDREISDDEAERVADELVGTPVDSPTSRAYLQQAIAEAVRSVDVCTLTQATTDVVAVAEVLRDDSRYISEREWDLLAGLAAAAYDDRIWDALAQVRQVVVLSRAPANEAAPEVKRG